MEVGALINVCVRKMKSVFAVVHLLLKGVFLSFRLRPIECTVLDFYTIRGLRLSDFCDFVRAYTEFNGGELSKFNKLLYVFSSKKYVLVAVAEGAGGSEIIGMDMFYCNVRDFKESTVHEGFVGVSSNFQGRGVATELRRLAIINFSKNGFSGISSRISLSNHGSLSSAKKLGFLPIEQYFDEDLQEERYYLIRPLEARK